MTKIKWFYLLSVAVISFFAGISCEGPEGPAGPQGPCGLEGPPGEDGQDGDDGEDGSQIFAGTTESAPSELQSEVWLFVSFHPQEITCRIY